VETTTHHIARATAEHDLGRVVVVDDDPDLRELLRHVFEHAGYAVTALEDGSVALDAIAATRPDIVVLDVEMPRMNGWQVLEAVRADTATAELPVILCTVRSTSDDVIRGWSLGCDEYVTKPFDTDELLGKVAAVLGRP